MSFIFPNKEEEELSIKLIAKALETGFTEAAVLDASTIQLLPEVRKMCEANTCGIYGKNWGCPPGCGDLETCRRNVERFHWGILVQTVGKLEDSFDFEAITETSDKHKENVLKMAEELKKIYQGLLALGAGGCTICKTCAYPDPCRFPEKSMASMEAYGIVVSDLCTANGLKYYYGPNTIAFTSCYLIN